LPTVARVAVLIMLLLGFLGPWFETCDGTVHGYHVYAGGSVAMMAEGGGWVLLGLLGLTVPFLFIVVLVNLVRDALGEREAGPSGLELAASGAALMGIGWMLPIAAAGFQWGYWITLAGIIFALVAALRPGSEPARSPPSGEEQALPDG
jgi:hypothetical protein